jgi:micrococcal nuclease
MSCSFHVPVAGDDRPDVITVRTDNPAARTTGTAGSDGRTQPRGVPADAQVAEVASITDGDTLRALVDGTNEAVRLLEVDAPETSGGCGAAQATEFVRRFVPPGSTVWLEPDVSDRDRYGRLLRYVWRDDAQLLNERLIEAGWAEAKLYEPDDGRWTAMRQAQQRARDARAGIWELCDMAGAPGGPPASDGTCDRNYSGCVPVYPPDVDCDRVDGPVTVLGKDPHNLDGNRDGRACEGPPG